MIRFPAHEVTERVTVQTFEGTGSHGDNYAPPVTTLCQFEGGRQTVRDASGAEVIAQATLRLDPNTDRTLDIEALFAPDSLVDVRAIKGARIATAGPQMHRGRLIYLEVTLT